MNTRQFPRTPGPWEYVSKLSASENHKGFLVRTEKATRNGKWALAEVRPGDEDGRLGEANARLIAAAPELLEALQEVADRLALHTKHSEDLVAHMRACKAIAKATGSTQ
jgi:hypothetical protein